MKQKLIFAGILGLIGTGLIFFTLITHNLGVETTFYKTWLSSWALALAIVVPVSIVVSQRV